MNEENTVLGLLYKQFEEDKESLNLALIQGQARDYAEYRYMCGKLTGLSTAQAIVNEMVDRLRKQEA
jgi:hypothetical protein